MLTALVSGELPPSEFEKRFFAMWGDDERCYDNATYRVLEDFFFVVDDYVDNPRLRDSAKGDLGPEELKQGARDLLCRAGFEPPAGT